MRYYHDGIVRRLEKSACYSCGGREGLTYSHYAGLECSTCGRKGLVLAEAYVYGLRLAELEKGGECQP